MRTQRAALDRWIVRAREQGYSWRQIGRAARIDASAAYRIYCRVTGYEPDATRIAAEASERPETPPPGHIWLRLPGCVE